MLALTLFMASCAHGKGSRARKQQVYVSATLVVVTVGFLALMAYANANRRDCPDCDVPPPMPEFPE